MELLQRHCPTCFSSEINVHVTYLTQHHGPRNLYRCTACETYFSETKNTLLAGVKKPLSLVWRVLKARSEGLGKNATARTFGISKNTVQDWEQRCADLKPVLLLYSLAHAFLQMVVEGDEAYTKVEKNVPPDHVTLYK